MFQGMNYMQTTCTSNTSIPVEGLIYLHICYLTSELFDCHDDP